MDINTDIAQYIMNGCIEDDPYPLTDQEQLIEQQKHQLFNSLVKEFPVSLGLDASQIERQQLQEGGLMSEFTYGEVNFLSFAQILFTLKARHGLRAGGVFYDLGSGTGKGVLAGALLHSFECCKGIEIFERLHSIALSLQTHVEAVSSAVTCPMQFIHSDILAYDWSDATVIFVNSTCFKPETLRKIGDFPAKPGTLSISLTYYLPTNEWKILEKVKKEVTWGTATFIIQEKVDREVEEKKLKEFGEALNK